MLVDQKETFLFRCLYVLHKMLEGCGLWTDEEVTPWRDLTLVQQGYSGQEGWGAHRSEHRDIFVRLRLPLFKTAKVWSVALVAHRGELVLIIQTDGPLGELVLWDYLTFLGSAILWVTWQEMRGGLFFFFNAPLICFCWELNTCSHFFVVLEWISDVSSGWSRKTFPELIFHVEITFLRYLVFNCKKLKKRK